MPPSLKLSKVHEYQRVPGTESDVRLVRMHPYIRIVTPQEPPLYIQDGMIFSEGGPQVADEDIPDAFWEEVSKTSPAQLEVVKFVIPESKRTVQKLDDGSGETATAGGERKRRGR